MLFEMAKQMQKLTIGNIKVTIILSTIEVKSTNDDVATVLLVKLPVIKYKVAIRGAKDSIILHNDLM